MNDPQFVGNISALQKPDRTGGIDFNPDKMTLQVQNTGGDMEKKYINLNILNS
jgi:hypothetical protein